MIYDQICPSLKKLKREEKTNTLDKNYLANRHVARQDMGFINNYWVGSWKSMRLQHISCHFFLCYNKNGRISRVQNFIQLWSCKLLESRNVISLFSRSHPSDWQGFFSELSCVTFQTTILIDNQNSVCILSLFWLENKFTNPNGTYVWGHEEDFGKLGNW